MSEFSPLLLERQAQKLEVHIAFSQLIKIIFPHLAQQALPTGRYRFITQCIENQPDTLRVLVNGDHVGVREEWHQILKSNLKNIQFLHGLAVIYRELSTCCSSSGIVEENLLLTNVALWILLLSSPDFWEYFSKQRIFSAETRERIDISLDQKEHLFEESIQELLSIHSSSASREFTAGNLDRALIHFRCLDLARTSSEHILKTLQDYDIYFGFSIDTAYLERIRTLADKLLDDWGATLIREAEKITHDEEAIKKLPEGMRQHYQGGLTYMHSFFSMNIPVKKALCKGIELYNDWCYDLHITSLMDQAKPLMAPAQSIVEQLIPLCSQSNAFCVENQLLSEYYLIRGFICDDLQLSVEGFQLALKWNPVNRNAEELLEKTQYKLQDWKIREAIGKADSKDFSTAHSLLDSLESEIGTSEAIQYARANIHYRHARYLKKIGFIKEALTEAETAKSILPNEPLFDELLVEINQLVPEASFLPHLRKAQDALDAKQYDEAIVEADFITEDSQCFDRAKQIRSSAYSGRGIEKASNNDLSGGLADLNYALKLNTNPEERRIISLNIKKVNQSLKAQEFRAAIARRDWVAAEQVLRDLLGGYLPANERKDLEQNLAEVLDSRALALFDESPNKDLLNASIIKRALKYLEEAASLDPQNISVYKHLDMVRRLRVS